MPASLSARRCTGALRFWASSTRRTIPARTVPRPTAVARTSSVPEQLRVAPTTVSPAAFSTGRDSPVSIDSSAAEAPAQTTPSTGIFSPGRTRTRSPTWTCPTGIRTSVSPTTTDASRAARARSRPTADSARLRAAASRPRPTRRVATTTATPLRCPWPAAPVAWLTPWWAPAAPADRKCHTGRRVGRDHRRGDQRVHGGGAMAGGGGRPPQEWAATPEEHDGRHQQGGGTAGPPAGAEGRSRQKGEGKRPCDGRPHQPLPPGVRPLGGGRGCGAVGHDHGGLVAERVEEHGERPRVRLTGVKGHPGAGGGEVHAGVDDAGRRPQRLLDPGGAGPARHAADGELHTVDTPDLRRQGGSSGTEDGLRRGGHVRPREFTGRGRIAPIVGFAPSSVPGRRRTSCLRPPAGIRQPGGQLLRWRRARQLDRPCPSP